MVERKKAGAGRKACGGVRVEPEERRHLIEACAFFRAQRYRVIDPGGYREEDRRQAEAEIDTALGSRRKGAKR
ncbi:MAG: hypothetical protein FJY54_17240 [Betaproteobacteria bacterium]|nr:hypothetical protein [Betaproteobacteria bacterium]